jgi:hypothetical protein
VYPGLAARNLARIGPCVRIWDAATAFRPDRLHHTTKKGIRMSKSRNAPTSLLHRLGVAEPARVLAFDGSGAPKIGRAALLVVLVLGALLLTTTPALATGEHTFSDSFGAPGSGPGELTEPAGVAVDEATGDVYVVDKGDNRVERFSSTGSYLGQFNGSGTYEVEGGKWKRTS